MESLYNVILISLVHSYKENLAGINVSLPWRFCNGWQLVRWREAIITSLLNSSETITCGVQAKNWKYEYLKYYVEINLFWKKGDKDI